MLPCALALALCAASLVCFRSPIVASAGASLEGLCLWGCAQCQQRLFGFVCPKPHHIPAVFQVDNCCCGCSAHAVSCTCAYPPCLGYFRHLFGTRVEKCSRALTKKSQPKKILVCMMCFPGEHQTRSWAGGALAALGHNTNPKKLQAPIRKAFIDATSQVVLECERFWLGLVDTH